MKTLIVILILLSFLQTTFIPLDLVLLVLLLRALIKTNNSNFYLAFSFGLLLSHLTNTPLGFQSVVFLVLVELAQLINKAPISHNLLTIVPITLVFLSLNSIAMSLLLHQSIQLWPKIVFESVLSLPVYVLLRIWEERFVISDIKLRL